MKLALIGLPQVGKKTVFSLMTGIGYDHLVGRPTDYHVGAVKVADLRVDKLSAFYKPEKPGTPRSNTRSRRPRPTNRNNASCG